MADTKASAFTLTAALTDDDTIPVIEDQDGIPLNRQITFANLRAALGSRIYNATGVGVSAVSAETVVATLSIPSQPATYRVIPSYEVFLSFSAVAAETHTWKVRFREDSVSGTLFSEIVIDADASRSVVLPPTHYVEVSAGAAKTIVATVVRTAGTNTVTTFADTLSNKISGIVVPSI